MAIQKSMRWLWTFTARSSVLSCIIILMHYHLSNSWSFFISYISPNLNVPDYFPIIIPIMSLILKCVFQSDCKVSLVRFVFRFTRTRSKAREA